MTKPVLGTAVAGGGVIQIDLQRLLVSRLLVQANSGAGKSWALRRLLEQTHGQVPHVVLDVEEEFHTLREKFPYVLAGIAGADCRADVKTAPLLARRILEHGFSSIISIYELKAHERMRFVRVFIEALIAAPRTLWRPLLVVVDEAHLFCPEKGNAESAPAVIDLMTRGRKRGLCGVLATQRIAKLNKDAAAEANNKMIGRAGLDLDMKRSADELGFTGREEQHRLRVLPPGQFYLFGPAFSPAVTLVKVGQVHTTHPQPGDRGQSAPPPAPAQMKAILAKLADLPKEAEQEEGEVERLRGRVAELERAQRAAPGAGKAELAAEYTRGREEGFEAGRIAGADQLLRESVVPLNQIKAASDAIAKDLAAIQGHCGVIANAANHMGTNLPSGVETRRPTASHAPQMRSGPVRPAFEKRQDAAPGEHAVARLQMPQQRILDALAWLESVGIDQASKVQLALLADASPRSSGYANNLGALRTAGLIYYPSGGQVGLTTAGRGASRTPSRPPTTEDLHRTLQERLAAPQWRILQALIERYPEAVPKVALADLAGTSHNSSGYANNLGALRTLGFIDYPRPGHVVALPVLFLGQGR